MKHLIEGHTRFQQEVHAQQREEFEKLAGGQSPHTMFITCADSRVAPELILAAKPGEIFVHRNVGNIVPPYSHHVSGVVAAIEYAVKVLQVKDLVICGHSDCGAMKALCAPESLDGLPTVKAWLKHAETAHHVFSQVREGCEDDDLHALTQENVVTQLDHLRTLPVVAAALARGTLRLHGWIYDIHSGSIVAYNAEQGKFETFTQADPDNLPHATPRSRFADDIGGEAA